MIDSRPRQRTPSTARWDGCCWHLCPGTRAGCGRAAAGAAAHASCRAWHISCAAFAVCAGRFAGSNTASGSMHSTATRLRGMVALPSVRSGRRVRGCGGRAQADLRREAGAAEPPLRRQQRVRQECRGQGVALVTTERGPRGAQAALAEATNAPASAAVPRQFPYRKATRPAGRAGTAPATSASQRLGPGLCSSSRQRCQTRRAATGACPRRQPGTSSGQRAV